MKNQKKIKKISRTIAYGTPTVMFGGLLTSFSFLLQSPLTATAALGIGALATGANGYVAYKMINRYGENDQVEFANTIASDDFSYKYLFRKWSELLRNPSRLQIETNRKGIVRTDDFYLTLDENKFKGRDLKKGIHISIDMEKEPYLIQVRTSGSDRTYITSSYWLKKLKVTDYITLETLIRTFKEAKNKEKSIEGFDRPLSTTSNTESISGNVNESFQPKVSLDYSNNREAEVLKSVQSSIDKVNELLKKSTNASLETKYDMRRLIEKDLPNLFQTFSHLSDEEQEKELLQTLLLIENAVSEIESRTNQSEEAQKQFEQQKSLFELRYKNKDT